MTSSYVRLEPLRDITFAGRTRAANLDKVSTSTQLIMFTAHKTIDGYDLPPALSEWLWPPDGTVRDFQTLQVVFGRGNEYFASDKNGKLEFKEPEKKEPPPEEQMDSKPSLRRTRTMSVFMSSADAVPKLYSAQSLDDVPPVPTQKTSQPPSRPSSILHSTRPSLDSAFTSHPNSRSPSLSSLRSSGDSVFTQSMSRPSSIVTTASSQPPSEGDIKPYDNTMVESTPTSSTAEEPQMTFTNNNTRTTRRARPLSISFKPSSFPRIAEDKPLQRAPTAPILPPLPVKIVPSQQQQQQEQTSQFTQPPDTYECGIPFSQPVSRPTSMYAHASVQTDPLPSPPPPPKSLHVNTSVDRIPEYAYTPSAREDDDSFSPTSDEYFPSYAPMTNHYRMGSMSSFFNKPGYRLGDGWGFGRVYGDDGEEYIEEEEEDEEEDYDDGLAAWEAANGRLE